MTGTLLNSKQVRTKCGSISEMTLWRWSRDEAFPKPVRIHGRKYFPEIEIDAWVEAQRQNDADEVVIPNADAGRGKGRAANPRPRLGHDARRGTSEAPRAKR